MSKRTSDLDDFLREVEHESRAAGDAAAGEFQAYGEHFRLARELITLRRKRGWTQQQLSKASGVQQSEISRLERGHGNPTFRTLVAIAQTGDMTVGLVACQRPTRAMAGDSRAARGRRQGAGKRRR